MANLPITVTITASAVSSRDLAKLDTLITRIANAAGGKVERHDKAGPAADGGWVTTLTAVLR